MKSRSKHAQCVAVMEFVLNVMEPACWTAPKVMSLSKSQVSTARLAVEAIVKLIQTPFAKCARNDKGG
jgi:hypothetical protein